MDRDHDLRMKKKILERTKALIPCIFDTKYTFSTVSLHELNFPPRPTIKKDNDAIEFKVVTRRFRVIEGGANA